MIKKSIKTCAGACLLFIAVVLAGVSCSDYLNIDRYFDDEFRLDSTFTQRRYVEAYMWGMVTMFPDESYIYRGNHTPGIFATDEGYVNFRESGNVYYGLAFAGGLVTPDRMWDLNKWGTYYQIIRKCNTILTRMDEAGDMTMADHRRIEGYTRFFRAYAYYNLLIDFGPPILLGDEVVNNNEEMSYYDRPRSTYDEAVEFICTEFERAAIFMNVTQSPSEFGRPTRGAAYALVARLRLIHASPLFNGGPVAHSYFGNWRRKTDGAYYVSQSYDERRWAIAAAAAKRVMDMEYRGNKLYSLYTVDKNDDTPVLPAGVTSDPNFYQDWPNGAAGIDPLRSYAEIFNGEAVAALVPEFIWARTGYGINNILQGSFPFSINGWSRIAVTQKVVDAYLMDDGRTRQEASQGAIPYYSEVGFTNDVKWFSGYKLNSGVYNMYVNREMRFYASVGFNECNWPCSSSSEYFDHKANYYYGGEDGRTAPGDGLNYTVTGYVIKKYVNPFDAFLGTGARRMSKPFAIIRHAEILLSYAEALNNLTGTHQVEVDGQVQSFSRDPQEMSDAFNPVRYRAGLPGMDPAAFPSRSKFQEIIERERMVEFLFENRRYYDVRRWGIYEETEREPITGMNMDGGDRTTFYQRVQPSTSAIRGRVVNKRLAFVPIPRAEIRRLPSLDQNPGW
ncbi:MAG: RagB/SusD family nutrient uptake outer membrane protein [Tannerella sp.]|nr:RagB/SusD family nutrient uptake outer membrane protein [Tannerella sp.]